MLDELLEVGARKGGDSRKKLQGLGVGCGGKAGEGGGGRKGMLGVGLVCGGGYHWRPAGGREFESGVAAGTKRSEWEQIGIMEMRGEPLERRSWNRGWQQEGIVGGGVHQGCGDAWPAAGVREL